jgi:hypothetical protein
LVLRSEDKQTAPQAFHRQLIMRLLRASVGSTEASNDRLARAGLISASRMPKLEFRPRLSVWWALPANFVQRRFQKYVLCRYSIDWDTERHRQLLPNTREISLAARDSHDRVRDFRCQAVPGGDKL